ncbi:hypothetical protein [Methanobrevibacter arboriphilus]|nr:hypothetical protein [Methanobrevibacter arboriphilus]
MILDKIKKSIEENNLNKEIHSVESLIEIGYNSIDIAAALLKMNKEN